MSVDPLKFKAPSQVPAQLSAASPSPVEGTDESDRVPEGAVSAERVLAVLRVIRLQAKRGHSMADERCVIAACVFLVAWYVELEVG